MRDTYKIVRLYRNGNGETETIKRGLTLEEAQAHCRREDTHEKAPDGNVLWFDGYEED